LSVKIVVLGAGPGGYVAAVRAAQLGAEVTLIEADSVGGTCLNRGCIPSKVMITTAELLGKIRKADAFGITVDGDVRVNMPRLLERKEKVVQDQCRGVLNLLKHHRIRVLSGTGYVKERGVVRVRLNEGGEEDVAWDRLILATGTRPLSLPGLPFDGEKIISSDHALELREVPESILIVGGGVIGCEFAFLFSSLGARVVVVEALSRILPLPSVDEDCSKVLQREMKKRKIVFMVNRSVEAVSDQGGKLRVEIGPSPFLESPTERDRKPLSELVDKVLVCVGRSPNTTDLGDLEALGIRREGRGWIEVDARMEAGGSGVYAIGDVLGPSKVMLAHVASMEGRVAAENAMGALRKMDYSAVPGAIFTTPEVADVGLTEAQARERGVEARSDTVLFRVLGKAHAIGEIAGQAKIVSEKGSGRVLGVHLVGPHATELLGEATLAVKTGCTTAELSETIHAHPTLSEIMLETSLKALDQSLHG